MYILCMHSKEFLKMYLVNYKIMLLEVLFEDMTEAPKTAVF